MRSSRIPHLPGLISRNVIGNCVNPRLHKIQRHPLTSNHCLGTLPSNLLSPSCQPTLSSSSIRYLHSSTTLRLPSSSTSKPEDHISTSPKSNNSNQPNIEGATDLSHAHFISSASSKSDFNPSQTPEAGQDLSSLSTIELNSPSTSSPNGNGHNGLGEWQGKLSPTSSHLFKLLIPLPTSNGQGTGNTRGVKSIQTAFLLHPSQPLSHLSRLIIGSLPRQYRDSEITYLSVTGEAKDIDQHLRNAEEEEEERLQQQQQQGASEASLTDADADVSGQTQRQEGGPYLNERENSKGRWQEVSWSQSTDLSDFIKQSCLNERFKIVITPNEQESSTVHSKKELILEVIIPSFASRTHYIRRRLLSLTKELDKMTKQKKSIDYKAHKGAQKLAVAALGGGVVYWGTVIRFTFFTDAGWDLMEPVTWATGFAALLGSAAFLIYHNREVSYSSLLDLSITARQRTLYDQAGLDIEKWTEMVSEAKTLRREIRRIASDYDIEWKGELENLAESSKKSMKERREEATSNHSTSGASSNSSNSSSSGETEIEVNERVISKKQSQNPNSSSSSSSTTREEEEKGKEHDDHDNDDKIDIDKTIQEASELAEQSENQKTKIQSAQRKGKNKPTGENDDDDRGSNSRKGEEKQSGSEIKGIKKAKEIIES